MLRTSLHDIEVQCKLQSKTVNTVNAELGDIEIEPSWAGPDDGVAVFARQGAL